MSRHYKHVSLDERVEIDKLLDQGVAQVEIARQLGRARSTICREIARRSWRPSNTSAAYTPYRPAGRGTPLREHLRPNHDQRRHLSTPRRRRRGRVRQRNANQDQELADLTANRARLEAESDTLLAAHFADAIDLDTLKRRQDRIRTGRADVNRRLAELSEHHAGRRAFLHDSLRLLTDAHRAYTHSGVADRRLANQASCTRRAVPVAVAERLVADSSANFTISDATYRDLAAQVDAAFDARTAGRDQEIADLTGTGHAYACRVFP